MGMQQWEFQLHHLAGRGVLAAPQVAQEAAGGAALPRAVSVVDTGRALDALVRSPCNRPATRSRDRKHLEIEPQDLFRSRAGRSLGFRHALTLTRRRRRFLHPDSHLSHRLPLRAPNLQAPPRPAKVNGWVSVFRSGSWSRCGSFAVLILLLEGWGEAAARLAARHAAPRHARRLGRGEQDLRVLRTGWSSRRAHTPRSSARSSPSASCRSGFRCCWGSSPASSRSRAP